ncbi:hypothetical protein [Hymenobacter swuensis]|uniref:Uncharacterized protein n=1 Tax=Hymenobacter swuensis DY53 TaxID=1227739 RepID=W8EUY9_9BACT|nr:hypothetical protein [Hymenobacter swuensis]AHJ96358.1 hypothetical protein Hsw_0763 [Hymenobacter swuensis DY53]
MLHSILFAPFTDAALQARYEAALATLTAAGTEGVLLGNLPVASMVLPAVLVQQGGAVILLLAAGGGQLSIPMLETEPWRLEDQQLAGFEADDNPLRLFRRQRATLAGWLAQQPELPQPIGEVDVAGLLVFDQLVRFAAEVEYQLDQLLAADQFQLVPQVGQLPRRLAQLPTRLRLPAAALAEWAEALVQYGPEPPQAEAEESTPEEAPSTFWGQKARQIWGWLGAEDVPADPPYGNAPAAAVAAGQEEKQRLEQLRQQVVQELQQQRREMEAREAEREESIAQLRAQLTQAPSATAEVAALQARLTAETQEKQQLQAAIQASRTEAETRNQALDARIQQLGQQLAQLQAQPPVAAAMPTAFDSTPLTTTRPVAGRPVSPAVLWRLQWQRGAVVVASIAALGGGLWAVTQLPVWLGTQRPAAGQTNTPVEPADDNTEAAAPTLFDIQPDTVALDSTAEDAPLTPAEEHIIAADSLEQQAHPGEILDSVAAETPEGDI